MGLTHAQLLASLGFREQPRDQWGLYHEVEDAAGVRVLGELCQTRDRTFMGVTICYGTATQPVLPICVYQAMAEAGRFAPIMFWLGGAHYLWEGAWSVFTEADACAFVRAVIRELEAGRMPDFDALLTVAEGSDPARVINWRN